ncbi:MAG: hypothetical protein NAOJABEB_03137 [Steroidobacteraceae bacterium]|nr:hypothetical protein [Steroidobacteraceae bacterium]
MPKRIEDNRPDVIYCACGCGEIVPRHKQPSQQKRYINFHQHRGRHNGNYRGGKETRCCPICGTSFETWTSHDQKTCGSDECYRKWQGLTSSARGRNKVAVQCAYCGKELWKYPSQVKERNFCNRLCLAAYFPKQKNLNGHWKGGKWRFVREQVLLRDNHKCVICGFEFYVQVHHITPVADGGTNDFSNLITLCPNHHVMADRGALNLESLRNTDWTPAVAFTKGAAQITDRASRSHTRRERVDSRVMYPGSASLQQVLEQDEPSDSHQNEPSDQ